MLIDALLAAPGLQMWVPVRYKCRAEAVVRTCFLLHFPVFSDALLWMKILPFKMKGPNIRGGNPFRPNSQLSPNTFAVQQVTSHCSSVVSS